MSSNIYHLALLASPNLIPSLLNDKLKYVVIATPGCLTHWPGSRFFKEKFLRAVDFADNCTDNRKIRITAIENYNRDGGEWWYLINAGIPGAIWVRPATEKEIGKWVTYQHNVMRHTSDYKDIRRIKQKQKNKSTTGFSNEEILVARQLAVFNEDHNIEKLPQADDEAKEQDNKIQFEDAEEREEDPLTTSEAQVGEEQGDHQEEMTPQVTETQFEDTAEEKAEVTKGKIEAMPAPATDEMQFEDAKEKAEEPKQSDKEEMPPQVSETQQFEDTEEKAEETKGQIEAMPPVMDEAKHHRDSFHTSTIGTDGYTTETITDSDSETVDESDFKCRISWTAYPENDQKLPAVPTNKLNRIHNKNLDNHQNYQQDYHGNNNTSLASPLERRLCPCRYLQRASNSSFYD